MSAVAVLPTIPAVDAAWERFRALAAPIADDPTLLSNRSHMEALARAERDWKAAFLALEAAA
jgi:hypothetical protein